MPAAGWLDGREEFICIFKQVDAVGSMMKGGEMLRFFNRFV
jgi:hypothetical protein